MKLELAILAGAESKAFLATLTQQIDRLESLTSKIGAPGTAKEMQDEWTDDADTGERSEDESEDEAPPKKTATKKPKKITLEQVNAACKAHAKAGSFQATKTLLKKKFKVDSVQDLDEDQYADVIAALTVDDEE